MKPNTKTIVKKIRVSRDWFDAYNTHKMPCPACKKELHVIVSILTLMECPYCKQDIAVEFQVKEDK